MKQEIYTIPLWDAFKKNTECPMCEIEKDIEKRYIEFVVDGDTLIDPVFNKELKNYTFCEIHFRKLFEYPDKLGLSIIVDKLIGFEMDYLRILENNKTSEENKTTFIQKMNNNFFKPKHIHKSSMQTERPCYLCLRIDDAMDDYFDTMIKLWEKNKEFRDVYEASKGFCRIHFQEAMDWSQRIFKNKIREEFINVSFKVQNSNLERLSEEIKWLITKYDYRFANEPWKNSKDALQRSIMKFVGNFISEK